MKTLLAILATLMLSACSSLGPTPEQLKAMELTSSSFCITSSSWNGAPSSVHYVSFGGKSVGTAGGGGKAACGASLADFSNDGKAITLPAGSRLTPNADGTLTVIKP